MWSKKCLVIPVITAATGIVTKGLKISGNSTRKAFNTKGPRFSYLKGIKYANNFWATLYILYKKNIYTRSIAHNKESARV
jgi:hypothetical protein